MAMVSVRMAPSWVIFTLLLPEMSPVLLVRLDSSRRDPASGPDPASDLGA